MQELLVLEDFGLTEAEAKVYLALIELGSTLAGPVIKKAALHRGTTYQILQRLKEKGLVSSVIKGKKQYFQPADPDRLMDLLEEKQDKLNTILPSLNAKLEASKEKQEVTVFYGVKGIRTVLDKMIDELTPIGQYYDFGVSGMFKEVMGSYWYLWQRRKKKAKIKSYVIFDEKLIKANPKLLKDYYGSARFHSSELSMTDTMIYHNTVILFIWTADPPIATVIKNKDNALSYRNQFKLMWKHAKKIGKSD